MIARLRFFLLCIALFSSNPMAGVETSSGPAEIKVEFNGGLVTVETSNAPLQDIMRAIGEIAGFRTVLVGDFSAPELVDVSFQNLPLHKAVDRLVRTGNRIIVYAPLAEDSGQKNIAQVWLLQAGTAQTDMSLNDGQSIASGSERDVNGYKLARLTAMLQPEQAEIVRNRAALALGRFQDERAVLALEPALLDNSPSVRKAVINSLGLIGNEQASEALVTHLLDEDIDESDRRMAIRALSKHDTEIARDFLSAGGNVADTNN